MIRLARPVTVDWQDIELGILKTAAEHLVNAACTHSGLAPNDIAVQSIDQKTLRISIADAALIRREQGDATSHPRPFLSPSADDRREIRDAIIGELKRALA